MIWARIPEKVAMLIGGWKTRSVFDRYNIVRATDLLKAADLIDGYQDLMDQATTAKTATIAGLGGR